MASTSARRRTARARRPLSQPADRAAASTSARRRSARGPAAQTVLPDEIWEEVFLRLDAAADLVRASAACSSFHRIISERRFLHRFRSLRSPAVLGFSNGDLYAPVDPPHRSAPEARALEQSADFTFSFLPKPNWWCFRHARDGRVLLAWRISPDTDFKDFVVCDPLYRRYVKIPRIPDDLLASAAYNGMSHHVFPILAPAGENDEEESFRVICTVQLEGKVVVFIFSSCTQTWRAIISTICLPHHGLVDMPDYAHGCVHWMLDCTGYSLMLDISEMEFSIIDLLPPPNYESMRAIVEAEEGRLGLFTIGDDTIDLYCKNWQNNGVAAQEWQHDKLIPLPKDSRINYRWCIVGTAGRYVGLLAHLGMHYKYFVLDIKTSLLEELCTLKNGVVFMVFLMQDFHHRWHCQAYEMMMKKRHKIERDLSIGEEVGWSKNQQVAKSNPTLAAMNKRFGMIHWLSSLANIVSFGSLAMHSGYLASKLEL